MLRQAENKVFIEGILSEVNVREGSFTRDGKQMPYLSGNIIVKVNDIINQVETECDVPVNFFVTRYKKDGGENPAYKSIQDLTTNFTSIAACDVEHADRIRITSGSIHENSFFGKNGNLVTYPRIDSSFFQKVSKNDCKPQTRFENVICIGGIKEEMDTNGDPTGHLIIQGILPQYGGKVDVVNYKVTSKNAIDHIQSNWNKGDTVKVVGKLLFSSKTEYIEEAVGFGEPIRNARTVNVSDLIVTSGSATAFEGDAAFDIDEIATALNDRQVRLNAEKQKSETRAAAPKKSAMPDLGF